MKKYHIYLNSEEQSIVIESLIALKNELIQEGRYTDPVDTILVKAINAPIKRIKVR